MMKNIPIQQPFHDNNFKLQENDIIVKAIAKQLNLNVTAIITKATRAYIAQEGDMFVLEPYEHAMNAIFLGINYN